MNKIASLEVWMLSRSYGLFGIDSDGKVCSFIYEDTTVDLIKDYAITNYKDLKLKDKIIFVSNHYVQSTILTKYGE